MNSLEILKERLKVKPVVQPNEGVKVIIGVSGEKEKATTIKAKITEERDNGQKAREILERMKQHKLTHVIAKLPAPVEEIKELEPKAPIVEEEIKVKKRPKKVKNVIFLDEEAVVEEKIPEGGPQLEAIEPKQKKDGIELDMGEEVAVVHEEVEEFVAKPRKRITKKVVKGVIPLGTDAMIQIGDTPLPKRLPPVPKYNLRASTYYMNNRELFINFIILIFHIYLRVGVYVI